MLDSSYDIGHIGRPNWLNRPFFYVKYFFFEKKKFKIKGPGIWPEMAEFYKILLKTCSLVSLDSSCCILDHYTKFTIHLIFIPSTGLQICASNITSKLQPLSVTLPAV